ncbi:MULTISPECIES: nucleoside-diphosphate sugar epimerase/dehydratase [Caproicibacterium]|uniref:Nucleoside-diphosphate sugar epimerase/dehydratase n=1 Tax=Caproicibacterium argilliputei TaxID=3030016 RepID=A0AA97D9J8_9FIRM|nr:nucleoside-diphosphate sugar epimerase/dehydratase [Caproicibacterium argilliputei]WOC31341.1 nucleoside-diphosphate sugar epimerase/dehydratase [Caproicibacterium argilliputei]
MKKTNRIFRNISLKSLIPQLIVDVLSVYLGYWLAFVLRFDTINFDYYQRETFNFWIPWLILIHLACFFVARFYNTRWEFCSIDEIFQIFLGSTSAAAICFLLVHNTSNFFDISRFWRGVYVIAYVLIFGFVCLTRISVRFAYRLRRSHIGRMSDEFKRVMIVGAGEMGSMLIKDMKNAPESKGVPVVAIDDDPKKRGTRINGVKIVGGRNVIPRIAARYNIDEILLAMSAVSMPDKQEIMHICASTGCELKTIPALYEIVEGTPASMQVHDVDITDLLGRDEIHLNTEEISGYLQGKTIMVTGGGGSIGSELCRQIAHFKPKKIVVFDIYENNAYDLQNEMKIKYGDSLDLEVIIGSVRDRARVEHVMRAYRPDVLFHAAAHKHVPLMELSPGEAVKNNVFGTLNVAQTCDKCHVKRMVLISTDKAVNPTNIMGATKRICELIIQYMSRHSQNTEYAAVRFGNVLGSSGSVIPLFKRQIAAGGPVTVTHPDIIRYFMTIPEAARLVIQAGGMAHGGEIFVLDMGQPVKIVDLARNLIRLSGYEPDVDIKIAFTGLRPGEKLYEELLLDSEGKCEKTKHDLIYIGSPIAFNEPSFLSDLEELRGVAGADNKKMVDIVHRLVPTYSGHADRTDLLAVEADKEGV